MRIENIKFEGFKALSRFASVDFSKSNVTVIYGDNGCGKTTFLKTINLFLSQDNDALSSMGIKKISCQVSEGERINNIEVVFTDNGFDWTEFENSPLINSKSLSLGVERGISTQVMRIEPEILMEFFSHPKNRGDFFNESPSLNSLSFSRKKIYELAEELSYFLKRRNAVRFRNRRSEIDFNSKHLYLQSIKIENIEELLLQRYQIARITATRKIQSALFDTLSVAIDIENNTPKKTRENSRDLGKKLLESKDRIIEALDDGASNNFKDRIINILSRLDQEGELDKILEHSLLSELFENMIDELEVEKLILSSINLLVEKFNAYLINDKKLVVNAKEVYIDINGDNHSLNELSSGERHILTFLALVLFEGHERDFLIIDEPEISLNIKWQRELMSIFSSLLPNTQIIVASHSPALAKRNPDFLSELKVWRD